MLEARASNILCYAPAMTVARGISLGEHYHVFNRGAHKANLFRDEQDWLRFLFLLLHCQSSLSVLNVKRYLSTKALEEGFKVPQKQLEAIEKEKIVELVSFCVMPNHFHLLVKETAEGGIAAYMQRLATGYATYFNAKYKASGHLFEGRYKSVHVKDNDQLLYLSAYIHRNPRELAKWKGYELAYPYSSFQDLVEENRWGSLLVGDILTGQFDGTKQSNYLDFVNSSTAKALEEHIPSASLEIDQNVRGPGLSHF
jgi:putative transposase